MQPVRLALCASLLLCAPFVAYAAEWSAPTRIESVYVLDELDVIRLHVLVSNPVSNPANCLHPDFVDIRLDADGRTPTQQREMLNLINLAFVTRRSVRLRLLSEADPEPCSTAGTTSSIRVATGVQAIY